MARRIRRSKSIEKNSVKNNPIENKPIENKLIKNKPVENKPIKIQKKGWPLFWKIYGIVVLATLIVFAGVWVVLWRFLSAYEASQPENIMEGLVNDFNQGDISILLDNADIQLTELESLENVEKCVEKYILDAKENADSDMEWTFSKKIGDYTKNNPVYDIKCNGTKKAVISLVKDDETGEFNTAKWKLDKVQVDVPDTITLSITVPKDSKVMVNSVELGSEYISAAQVECQGLGNVTKYITAPKMTTYTVRGLYEEATVGAVGPVYGGSLILDDSDVTGSETGETVYTYTFAFESNKSFTDSVESRVIEITKKYGLYVLADIKFSGISSYVLSNSYAYSYLSKIESTNKWVPSHATPVFSDMKVFNYQCYTTDCFSCEVTFTETATISGSQKEYPTHIKYVFIKKGSTWYVADIVIKKS